MMLVKALLFGISEVGYWEFLRKKTQVNVYFLPVLTVAVQACALIAGGLVNLLGVTAWAVYLLGFGLLFRALWQEKAGNWKHYLRWGYVFFLVGAALAVVYLRGKVFTHNDNFTHWAIVVKRMLTSNRFPIVADTEIGFPYYPLGSSVFVYYFCKMVDNAEAIHMLAQCYMMLTAFLPLFVWAKENGAVCGGMITAAAVMIFGYSIRITELLVDTLLPLMSMSAVMYVLYECSDSAEVTSDKKTAVWLLVPLLVWLAQIKNSGMLFAYLAVALLFLYPRWDGKQLPQKLAVAVAPALGTWIWSAHCSRVFPQELQEKHAMTAGNYMHTFAEKSLEDMRWIAVETVEFMLTREGFCWVVCWLAVAGLLTFLFRPALKKLYFRLLAGITGIHVIYILGMVGMYLFSMPIEEAMTLASIERYSRTLDISAYYLILAFDVILISSVTKRMVAGLLGAACILLSVITVKKIPDSRPWMTLEHRIGVEYNIAHYGIEKNCSYFICIPEYDGHHYYKLIHNFLLGNMPTAARITQECQLEAVQGNDYLINMDVDNPIVQAWIAENYPEHAGENVVRLK